MNILFVVLLSAAALIGLLLLVALFTKRSYRIEREITIDRSRQDVFDYVRNLKNQDHFNKWVMVDPGMKKEFRGIDGRAGFVYACDGNKKAGAGEQEILHITEGRKIGWEIRFIRPFKGIARSHMELEPISYSSRELTRIYWVFSSRMGYPMNLALLLFNIEKTLGKDIDTSLVRLKSILEADSVPSQTIPTMAG